MPFRFGAADSATPPQAEAMSFWWVFLRPLVGSCLAGSLGKRRYSYPEQIWVSLCPWSVAFGLGLDLGYISGVESMESFSDDVLHGETMRPITTGPNAVKI